MFKIKKVLMKETEASFVTVANLGILTRMENAKVAKKKFEIAKSVWKMKKNEKNGFVCTKCENGYVLSENGNCNLCEGIIKMTND